MIAMQGSLFEVKRQLGGTKMSAPTTIASTTQPSIKVTSRLHDVFEKPVGSADQSLLSLAIHRPSSGF